MSKLRYLDLSMTNVTDNVVQDLADNLVELRHIALVDTPITDSSILVLVRLKHLHSIEIDGTNISDESVDALTKLNEVRMITLLNTSTF